jgi:hypothetical protein
MPLNSYAGLIRDKIARLARYSYSLEQRFYHGVPIRVRPAELDQPLDEHSPAIPNFTFISSPPPRWFEPDSSLLVVFKVRTKPFPGMSLPSGDTEQIVSDVLSAMNAWSTVSDSALRVGGRSDWLRLQLK